MGWEDTWIPECRRLYQGRPAVHEHPATRLLADRLEQETPNHRRLRVAVAYGRLPEEGRSQALESLRGELAGRGLMFEEWGSTTYSPFYCQGAGMLTLLAAEHRDEEMLGWCRRWWAAWVGLSAALSVPVPRDGQDRPRVPGSGHPRGDLLQHGEVLGPGLRCNRDRNRDNGILLRLLCGLETRWDRRVIDKVGSQVDDGRNLNLLQLAYVDRLLREETLSRFEYDPQRLARQVSKLAASVQVERWPTGYRAWVDQAQGRGPVHFAILVHEQRIEYLDRREPKQVRLWQREKEVPPAPVEPEVRLTLPVPETPAPEVPAPGGPTPRMPTPNKSACR